jgi:hypothetical protein
MNKKDWLGMLYLVAMLWSAITGGALIIQNKISWVFAFPIGIVDILMFWAAMRAWDWD